MTLILKPARRRLRCKACGLVFLTHGNLWTHRAGRAGRRCMTEAELRAFGWEQDAAHTWRPRDYGAQKTAVAMPGDISKGE